MCVCVWKRERVANGEEWRKGGRELKNEEIKRMEKRKKGTGFLYMHVFPFLKKKWLN